MVSRKLNRRRNKRNTRQRKGKKQTSKLIKCKRCNKSKRISRNKFNELRNAGMNINDIYKYLCCGYSDSISNSDKRSEDNKERLEQVPWSNQGPINKLSPRTAQAYYSAMKAKEALFNQSNMTKGTSNDILAYRRRELTRSLGKIKREEARARAKATEEARAKATEEARAKALEERARAKELEEERASKSKSRSRGIRGILPNRFKRLG
jgi:hypothetical protein